MKKQFILALLFVSMLNYAQDTIPKQTFDSIKTHSQIFSLSPISKKVDTVNGLVFGLGHVENRFVKKQTINGLNLEINPAPIAGAMIGFMALVYLPEIIKNNKNTSKDTINDLKVNYFEDDIKLHLNGINVSSGCFFTNTSMNGLNVSLGNKFSDFTGVSIAPLGTIADSYNGISIGSINANNNLKGVSVGIYNQSYQLNGVHLGLINQVKTNNGLQIGLFNISKSKGLQLGLWNKNSRHSFPIINW